MIEVVKEKTYWNKKHQEGALEKWQEYNKRTKKLKVDVF